MCTEWRLHNQNSVCTNRHIKMQNAAHITCRFGGQSKSKSSKIRSGSAGNASVTNELNAHGFNKTWETYILLNVILLKPVCGSVFRLCQPPGAQTRKKTNKKKHLHPTSAFFFLTGFLAHPWKEKNKQNRSIYF